MPSFKNCFSGKFKLYWSLFLLMAGFFLHFLWLNQPDQVVFDEVHFGKFASAYSTGEYFFDIHPPLGKLIIALGARWGGYAEYLKTHPAFEFKDIGEKFGDLPILSFRFFPALAGSLIPLTIFFFLLSLDTKKSTALLASLFCLLETALLTQSRFILLDAFLILFGFLGLGFFFFAQKKSSPYFFLILSGLFLGASIAVKWTGLSFLGMALIFLFIDWLDANEKEIFRLLKKIFSKKLFDKNFFLPKFNPAIFKKTSLSLLAILAFAFLVYIFSFAVHFNLLSIKGSGNDFMEENFRQNQIGFWGKFVQLNQKINLYNSSLTAPHPDSSLFWQWPILKKPVHYWDGGQARVIFFGNPVLWLGGFLGVILFLIFWKKIQLSQKTKFVILLGFWSNFLPFLSVTRALFLYHYLSALIFSFIMWAIVLTEVFDQKKPWVKKFQIIFVFLALISFFLFSFLSYGAEPLGQWHRKLLDAVLYY